MSKIIVSPLSELYSSKIIQVFFLLIVENFTGDFFLKIYALKLRLLLEI